ncbi:MAG TPA: NADH-quinone oxidoreductase subunit N, partial [Novosphingobium sp.]|nr:NADH-quinone oxidoreductase subunit N [Novosphingobium sp.]
MSWIVSLNLVAAEEILSAAGLVLMLVAAWAGDKSARAISVAAVAALVAASAFVLQGLGATGAQTSAFYGQYADDGFAAYAKLLIYLAAAVAVIVAPRFFAPRDEMRAEYPVLVLFAALGMGLMVSATDLLTLYIGLELNSLAA